MATPPPYEHNDVRFNAPHDTQAINMGGYHRDYGADFPPGQHPQVKKLLKLTLASAAVVFLIFVAQALFTDNSAISAQVQVDENTMRTSKLIGNLVGILVTGAIYALVYKLIAKGKNAGRLLGMVFCILGIIWAGLGLLSIMGPTWFLALFSLAWLIVNILWLVKALKPEVRHNLV